MKDLISLKKKPNTCTVRAWVVLYFFEGDTNLHFAANTHYIISFFPSNIDIIYKTPSLNWVLVNLEL